tara:strand:- start:32 stop:184 length:153 start_codon:yes stop_codon:yes gene_type:complete
LISKKLEKTTFNDVYKGIAIIKPIIPNNNPEKIITIKISRGCDLTDDEKM